MNLFNLSQTSKDFIKAAPTGKVLEISLAKAIADSVVMPSSSVESPTMYYRSTAFAEVSTLLSSVNDTLVFDLKKVMDSAQLFWVIRYNVLFPADTLYSADPDRAVFDFFGFGAVIDVDTASFLKANGPALVKGYNGFRRVVKDLWTREAEKPPETETKQII